MTINKTKLFTLLADYPCTLPIKQGQVHSDLVAFEFADIKVANTGFKPMVREAKFDLGELAIVTYLQAKAYNKPYVLMPAPVVARAQHHTIAYNSERGELKPADLAGKRVGVRAYSVTTGVWVRVSCRSNMVWTSTRCIGSGSKIRMSRNMSIHRPSSARPQARTWCRWC